MGKQAIHIKFRFLAILTFCAGHIIWSCCEGEIYDVAEWYLQHCVNIATIAYVSKIL